MDWTKAIERNREALKRIVAMLIAMAGLGAAGGPATLPRHLHRAVLRLLRPAESAARRLVIAAARGLPPSKASPAMPQAHKPKVLPTIFRSGVGTGILMPAYSFPPSARAPARTLPLFDRLRRRARRPSAHGVPRISSPGWSEPFPVAPRRPPAPDDPIDARRLGLRLQALGRTLDDLPGQARRFARWQAFRNRDVAGAQGRTPDTRPAGHAVLRRIWPLRLGRPPGSLAPGARLRHEVHEVLDGVHGLAFMALKRPDTS